MKKIALFTVLVLIAFSSVALAAIPVEVIKGKGTVLTLTENTKRVSLTDPAVADIILISPSEILINGKEIGETSLITWSKSGKKTFFDIIVAGDLEQLRAHVKALAPNDDITVEMVGSSVLLKGRAFNEEAIKKIGTISKNYAANVINFIQVIEPQQVMLEIRVAQIDRTKLNQMGIDFLINHENFGLTLPGLITSPSGSLPAASTGTGSGTSTALNYSVATVGPQVGIGHFPSGIGVMLRALAKNNLAKILAEPNLVVRSGEKGTFLVGSKVPVQTVTGVSQTASITYEDVGIKLEFSPVVLEDGTIRLKIDPAEVSNVIPSPAGTGTLNAPQIDIRTVSTSVDLKDGESLIMAGLISEETSLNIQKIPILGDIPILGAIFRSTREERKKMELAFFITPRLVKPNKPGAKVLLPGEEPISQEEKNLYKWMPVGKQQDPFKSGGAVQ